MPVGGARPGSGRKKGSKSTKTREIAERAAASGISPLEVMIETMRHFYDLAQKALSDTEKAKWLSSASEHAHDAAPFMHPRLQPVDGRGSTDQVINIIIQKLSEVKKK